MSDMFLPSFAAANISPEWADVSAFARWWHEASTPIWPPSDAEIFCTDDATAFCLYRNGRFQVEVYLIQAHPKLDLHAHPGVDVIQAPLSSNPNAAEPVLHSGKFHGDNIKKYFAAKGGALLTFQHWLDHEPSTASAAWQGATVGPIHEALIRRFFPNAFIEPGYADITKPANYRELARMGVA